MMTFSVFNEGRREGGVGGGVFYFFFLERKGGRKGVVDIYPFE